MRGFDQEAAERAGSADPAWLAARRALALDRFAETPMPSTQEEIWRYLELGFDFDGFGPVDGPGTALAPGELEAGLGRAADAQVIDGIWVGGSGPNGGSPHVGSLVEAAGTHAETLERAYASAGILATDRFAAAHDAFGGGGVLVHVPRGRVLERQVLIDVQATGPATATFPRIVFNAEEAAEAAIVVHLRSPAAQQMLVVPQFVVLAGDGAHVTMTIIQHWGSGTRSIGHARAVAGRDASVHLTEIGLGSRVARLHLEMDLVGRGSSAEVLGAYFGDEDQTLDYRYFMRHVGTNTRSDMFLKGAVEDQARSVFTGMIRIEESGQKTEAFQTNRNLILAAGAKAQSVPNLEILANDVRCGHGSTVGPLDEEQRYYLMSRGLTRDKADRLQVRGFFEEVIGRISDASVAAPVRRWINDKYTTAQAAGRV